MLRSRSCTSPIRRRSSEGNRSCRNIGPGWAMAIIPTFKLLRSKRMSASMLFSQLSAEQIAPFGAEFIGQLRQVQDQAAISVTGISLVPPEAESGNGYCGISHSTITGRLGHGSYVLLLTNRSKIRRKPRCRCCRKFDARICFRGRSSRLSTSAPLASTFVEASFANARLTPPVLVGNSYSANETL
jgi:hypothetical protein